MTTNTPRTPTYSDDLYETRLILDGCFELVTYIGAPIDTWVKPDPKHHALSRAESRALGRYLRVDADTPKGMTVNQAIAQYENNGWLPLWKNEFVNGWYAATMDDPPTAFIADNDYWWQFDDNTYLFDTTTYDNPVIPVVPPLTSTVPQLLLPARCASSNVAFARQWTGIVEKSAQAHSCAVVAVPQPVELTAIEKMEQKRKAQIERSMGGTGCKCLNPATAANGYGTIKPAPKADRNDGADDTCATELTGTLKRDGEVPEEIVSIPEKVETPAKKSTQPTRREQYNAWLASAKIVEQLPALTGYRETVASWKQGA